MPGPADFVGDSASAVAEQKTAGAMPGNSGEIGAERSSPDAFNELAEKFNPSDTEGGAYQGGDEPVEDASKVLDDTDLSGIERFRTMLGETAEEPAEEAKEETPVAKQAVERKAQIPGSPDGEATRRNGNGQVKGRDYSGLSGQRLEVAKKLHNDAFTLVSPILKEHEKLSGEFEGVKAKLAETETKLKAFDGQAAKASYYENPDAYMLSDDFKQVSNSLGMAEQVENHYLQQLHLMEEGKDFTPLAMSPDGRLVPQPMQKPSPQAKINLMHQLNQVTAFKGQLQGQLQASINNHRQQHQQVLGKIQGVIDNVFPYYKNADGAKKINEMSSILEKNLGVNKSNPLFSFAVAASLAALENAKIMVALDKQLKAQGKVGAIGRASGPPSGSGGSIGSSRGGKASEEVNGDDITMDTFDKMKAKIRGLDQQN